VIGVALGTGMSASRIVRHAIDPVIAFLFRCVTLSGHSVRRRLKSTKSIAILDYRLCEQHCGHVVLSQADWRSAVPVDMTTGTVTAVAWKYHHVGNYLLNGALPPNHGQI
jgi:hypothetical protein